MEFIGAIIYINLDYRKDRRFQMEQEFARMGIRDAKRFNAIPHEYGLIGCMQSHLAVLELAKKNGYKNILIFEDDFEFQVSKDDLDLELRSVLGYGLAYDVLMLAYNMKKSAPLASQKTIFKVLEAQTASAYIVHESFYNTLIKCYRDALPLLKETKLWDIYANDQVWKKLQPEARWYAFTRRLGKQRESYSDTTRRVENYGV
jgi:GR25 family glycosyltransferase involved in LPS biosynthesis